MVEAKITCPKYGSTNISFIHVYTKMTMLLYMVLSMVIIVEQMHLVQKYVNQP